MPVIAIGGRPGAGSSTVSELLSKTLKMRLFSIGKRLKKQEDKENEAKASESYWQSKGKDASHNKKVDEMIIKEAKKGNVVIDGKLAIHFLKDRAHFKVWLDCPPEVRARRYEKRDGIDTQQAMSIIKNTERSWKKYWGEIYGIDPFDQEFEADLVIDTSKKHPEEIVKEIIDGMEKLGISE